MKKQQIVFIILIVIAALVASGCYYCKKIKNTNSNIQNVIIDSWEILKDGLLIGNFTGPDVPQNAAMDDGRPGTFYIKKQFPESIDIQENK